MKKSLLVLISLSVIICVFASCGKSTQKQAIESTTADVANIEITAGVVKGGGYTNKSLGFKVVKPEDFDCQDYGDLVLTPDDKDFVFPDYYLLNHQNGKKFMQIEILDKKYSTIKDWKKGIIAKNDKAETKDDIIIGYRNYSVVAVGKKVLFATFDNGKLALITFNHFTYDEAMDFIAQNFKAL